MDSNTNGGGQFRQQQYQNGSGNGQNNRPQQHRECPVNGRSCGPHCQLYQDQLKSCVLVGMNINLNKIRTKLGA